eukprot:GEMP01021136.1.p1 GENE.GEMP01021136.1~~GEMP01021136.1.p1  ORF type:complete len:689 (+),score=114.41 GEMP01021136.1:108-2174(+)
MILYRNFGPMAWFYLIFTWRGSVYPQALGAALVSTTWCSFIIFYYIKSKDGAIESWIDSLRTENPLGEQMFTILLAYSLVFRTRMALSRYEEGLEHVQLMLSKWSDSFCCISAFTEASLSSLDPATGKFRLSPEEMTDLLKWRVKMCHWYSMLSSFAISHMRGGMDQDIDRLPIRALDFKPDAFRHSPRQKADEAALKTRTGRRQADAGFGFTNRRGLASLRGMWSTSQQNYETKWPRFTNNLDEEEKKCYRYYGEIDPAEAAALAHVSERVIAICGWINTAAIERSAKGDFNVPPSILSRAVNTLSIGLHGYQQSLKLSLTPFPFCFAQLTYYMLILYMLIIPVVMPETCRSAPVWAAGLCFLSTLGVFGISAISEELEDPFGDDYNDLPLLELHHDYIGALGDCLLPSLHRYQLFNDALRAQDASCKNVSISSQPSAPSLVSSTAARCPAPVNAPEVVSRGTVSSAAAWNKDEGTSKTPFIHANISLHTMSTQTPPMKFEVDKGRKGTRRRSLSPEPSQSLLRENKLVYSSSDDMHATAQSDSSGIDAFGRPPGGGYSESVHREGAGVRNSDTSHQARSWVAEGEPEAVLPGVPWKSNIPAERMRKKRTAPTGLRQQQGPNQRSPGPSGVRVDPNLNYSVVVAAKATPMRPPISGFRHRADDHGATAGLPTTENSRTSSRMYSGVL